MWKVINEIVKEAFAKIGFQIILIVLYLVILFLSFAPSELVNQIHLGGVCQSSSDYFFNIFNFKFLLFCCNFFNSYAPCQDKNF